MHVAIDTSILRQDPKREKAPMRALVRLTSGAKATVHIPEVVRGEFVSQQVIEVEKKLRDSESSLSSIARITDDEELDSFVKSTKSQVHEFLDQVASNMEAEFNRWLHQVEAVVAPIADDHGRRVMLDYFEGGVPYKNAKSRNDIPDSFIWHSIVDLLEEHGEVHVISNDGALYAAAQGHAGLIAHNSLEEFIQTEKVQAALREIAAANVVLNMLKAEGRFYTHETLLEESVSSHIWSALDGKTVSGKQIPDDNNEATVMGVSDPDSVVFDYDDIDYYGDGELGIAFSASVTCNLNYAIYKSDYHCLADEKSEQISIGERNDHYYDADEEYMLEVKGRLLVSMKSGELQDELDDEKLDELIESADFNLEVLDISIEGDDD